MKLHRAMQAPSCFRRTFSSHNLLQKKTTKVRFYTLCPVSFLYLKEDRVQPWPPPPWRESAPLTQRCDPTHMKGSPQCVPLCIHPLGHWEDWPHTGHFLDQFPNYIVVGWGSEGAYMPSDGPSLVS